MMTLLRKLSSMAIICCSLLLTQLAISSSGLTKNTNTIADSSLSSNARSSAVILQYHHVSDSTPKSTSISPALFAEHLDYLEKNNFHILALTEVTSALQKGTPLPDKSVVITFDDAYKNIYTNAFPMLKKRKWPFTLFVSTDPVNRNFGDFLSWQHIQEMANNGATIANHSVHHDHFVERKPNEKIDEWINRVKLDITTTEQQIKDKTGQSIKHFAWPYGETTPELQKLIISLGFIGLGQQSGAASSMSDFSLLPRYPMAASYAEMGSFRLKVNSLPLPVTLQTPTSPIVSNNNLQPTLEINLAKGDFQKDQLRCYASGYGELKILWLDEQKNRFSTQVSKPLPIGRSRYNCTAPSMSGKQYYWYSHAWLRLTPEGKAAP